MGKKIENLLNTVADMQKCITSDDALSEIIEVESDELSESELEFAAAAGGIPSYSEFLKHVNRKSK